MQYCSLKETEACGSLINPTPAGWNNLEQIKTMLCGLNDLCGEPYFESSRFSQCLRITNPKFPRFLRKFFIEIIEIKFFSTSPRCNWFSPVFLRVSVPPWWVLVVALLRCA